MKQDEQGKQKHQNGTKAPIPHSLFSQNREFRPVVLFGSPLTSPATSRTSHTKRRKTKREGRIGIKLVLVRKRGPLSIYSLYTDKNENKIFLTPKEIQNGAVAKSYMTNGLLIIGKYLRISSYIRKPFLIYDFATAPIEISLYMRKSSFSFYQCTVQHQGANQSQHCSAYWRRDTVYRCIQKYAKRGIPLCCTLCWSIFIIRGWADQKRIYGLFRKGCGGSCPIKNSLKCTKFPPSTYFYGK